MRIERLGLMDYHKSLALMEERHAEMEQYSLCEDCLLVIEHPPVVTMGNRNLEGDMLIPSALLVAQGVQYAKIDRGGSVTVHEPGQVVIYPLVRLDSLNLTVKRFVWCLEEAMIRCCARYQVAANRDAINPGVWVDTQKIGALGIRIQNKISKHGLAFNVKNDLSTFRWIVPCGIRGRGVTSLVREVDDKVSLDFSEVQENLISELCSLLAQVRSGELRPERLV